MDGLGNGAEMKSRAFGMALLVALAGCVSARYAYKYRMVEPESTPSVMIIEDDSARVEFVVLDASVAFKLTNKTKEALSIVWDECSLIVDGEAKKIFHEGVKYLDRMNHQPPTTVPPGSRISDIMTPSDNAYFVSAGAYSSWQVRHLFPTAVFTGAGAEAARKEIEGNVGKELGVYLVLDRAGQRLAHNARFRIDRVELVSGK